MPCQPAVRVVIRLPYNRPEDAPPNPPRVEWDAAKEQTLWEVIAKSRAIEGAGTDWKGLAAHLQVPLPYLLYRAQVRYEEDLRGLQGLATRIPAMPFPSAPSPIRTNVHGEYFPRVSDPSRPPLQHRDSAHGRMGSSSSATAGGSSTSGTGAGTSTLRPIGVRARLSSLGHARAHGQLRSPVNTQPAHSPLAGLPVADATCSPRTTKKVSSSSTITLQGPKRVRTPLQPLSSASSRAGSSSDAGGDDSSDSDESDEATRSAEVDQQLTQKLQSLRALITKDTLGLVADPASVSARQNGKQRGRPRPLSGASVSASGASLSSFSARRSPSHDQSLSSASVDSPQGSIPSIPSPSANPPRQYQNHQSKTQPHTRSRHLSHGAYAAGQRAQPRSLSTSHSNPQSPPRVTSPMPVPRHLSTPEKSSSPPMLSPGRAVGQNHTRNLRHAAAGLAAVSTGAGTASEASSFSDLSDADLSGSALESALMSNTRGGGLRFSSFARSHLTGGRRATRG